MLVIVFAAALVFSAILTPIARRLALKYSLVDRPDQRKRHIQPTPRLGGLAVDGAFLMTIFLVLIFRPVNLTFVNQTILGIDLNLFGMFVGAIILIVIGVVDDLVNLPAFYKLFWQSLAALAPVVFGIKIWWLSNPLGGTNIVLGNLTYLIVPLWILLIINVVNWLDGLDGLTTGTGLIAGLALGFLSLKPFVDQGATAILAFALAGACAGFLPYNFHPAKIFLGDAGSQFIGYMIAIFSIISGAKLATVGLVLAIPILDALLVIINRVKDGQKLWQGDRRHLHHRLLELGIDQRLIVAGYWIISALAGLLALNSQTIGKTKTALSLAAFMAILVIGIKTLEKSKNQASV